MKQTIFLIIIFLILNNIYFVLSQQCDPGYTFENGFCKSGTGNSNLHLAMCVNPSGTGLGSYEMYIGSTADSPCPAGWTLRSEYSSYQAITSNSVTIWSCQHQSDKLYTYFYIGGCNVGTLRKKKSYGAFTNIDDIRTITFTATNNLLLQGSCYSIGLPQNQYVTWFYEATSNTEPSMAMYTLCANDDLNDYEAEILNVQSWQFKETRCATGYAGPNCVQDNICLTSNGGCSHTCTRTGEGTATCSCNSGYRLNANGKTCDEIDECADGSSGCAHTCSNYPFGSFTCGCYDGYTLNGNSCDDINECTTGTSACNQICTNTPGSFSCSCNDGYTLSGDGKTCVDIDECAIDTSGCAQGCTNIDGSFICSCNNGYKLNGNGKSCDDVDECSAATSGCNQICTNTVGSFSCSCNSGFRMGADLKTCADIDECSERTSGCNQICTNSNGGFTCSCNSGFKLGADTKTCADIDECSESTSGCNQVCTNSNGGFTCSCYNGFRLGTDTKTCADIDECTENTSGCTQGCTNIDGSFTCHCNNGYRLNINDKTCDDIDECTENTSGCSQTCINSVGSFSCLCNSNYTLNANGKSCDDIDECALGTHKCIGVAACSNSVGGYNCNCPNGYKLNSNGKQCDDIDECSEGTSPCNQVCSNTIGSFTCSCNSGYSLESDPKTCVDINECDDNPTICGSANCKNSIGGYSCFCNNGYQLKNDGISCEDVNECLTDNAGCNQTCTNNIGSFVCSCGLGFILNSNSRDCDDINECESSRTPCGQSNCINSVGTYHCSCDEGYSLSNDNQKCTDIDECSESTSGCNQDCTNTIGSFICSCNSGFRLDSDSKTCTDIDECSESTSGCGQVCTNTIGSFTCSCNSGFRLDSDSKTCVDINECDEGISGCSQTCINSIGSFSCSCNSNYSLNLNGKLCDDIDECIEGISGCAQNCSNSIGGFACFCGSGFILNSNGKLCDDLDECQNGDNKCSGVATCSNLVGSYQCNCPATGYSLNANGKSCDDIDECQNGDNECTGDFTICENTQGGYECTCPSGFSSTSNGKDCQDIDECLSNENECDSNSVCQNSNGSYSCQCTPNYSHITPFKCEPKPIITSFYQKPIQFYTFIVKGFNFNQDSIVTITDNNHNEVDCKYQSGNTNQIECTTKQGLEVIGNVTVESNTLLSDPFKFKGAPFLTSYSSNPNTAGGQLVIFYGRNLPSGEIKLAINSIDCVIQKPSLIDEQIACIVPEGSGGFNNVKIINESVSNTDSLYLIYGNPKITSMSVVYTTGGILTVKGDNFGVPSKSKVSLNIGGTHECNDVTVLSHTLFTCQLDASTHTNTLMVNLVVDDLPMTDPYYFKFSKLLQGVEECVCNHGTCSDKGCICEDGFAGVSCNETSVVISPKPPTVDKPSIDIDTGKSNFGYKVSIIRIEELDYNQNIVESIQLLNETWGNSIPSSNKWVYNITLNNLSYLEATFQYFKQSTNISFASTSFIIPGESLKVSFETLRWPFISRLNTLRIVVSTDTLILSNNENECSINSPIKSEYNENVWSTIENPDTSIVARFISIAEIDNIPIVANIEILDSPTKTSSVIGISVPYFSKYMVVDPDFSVLLTNKEKGEIGNCKSTSSTINWRVATGVSIGAGAAVCLAGAGAYAYKKKNKDKKFVKNITKNRSL